MTVEIKEALEREYSMCSKAIGFYRKKIKAFEKKHKTATSTFLKKFDAGRMGDDQDFFDWYAFHNLLESWGKTQKALHSVLR